MTEGDGRLKVLIVTGLSGAGKSSALDVLEDLGWEVVDNLPLFLLGVLLRHDHRDDLGFEHAVAIGVDSRTRDFAPDRLKTEIARFKARPDLEVHLAFFACDSDVLHQRFTATRRRHPLAQDRPVMDAIRSESRVMAPIRLDADQVIDTTLLAQPDLRRLLAGWFGLAHGGGMTIDVVSFSYRLGLPREADLVFDVRFLKNPHYDAALRRLSGRDSAVAGFIAADPAWRPFNEGLTGLLGTLVPHYRREGKSYLTIAVGCTGGRHRSVFTAETIAGDLRQRGHAVTVRHRDLTEPA